MRRARDRGGVLPCRPRRSAATRQRVLGTGTVRGHRLSVPDAPRAVAAGYPAAAAGWADPLPLIPMARAGRDRRARGPMALRHHAPGLAAGYQGADLRPP